MAEHARPGQPDPPSGALDYLGERLDGARDLYLLALALGRRDVGPTLFGRVIREARIHFAAVLEEARVAGLDTGAIAAILGHPDHDLADSHRPELRSRVEALMEAAARNRPSAA